MTVGDLAVLRLVVGVLVLTLPTDDERLTGTGMFGCYCFFILEGGSTYPDPKEFGFFAMLIFLVNSSKLGTVSVFLGSDGFSSSGENVDLLFVGTKSKA